MFMCKKTYYKDSTSLEWGYWEENIEKKTEFAE